MSSVSMRPYSTHQSGVANTLVAEQQRINTTLNKQL
jgi:hypothetical protein